VVHRAAEFEDEISDDDDDEDDGVNLAKLSFDIDTRNINPGNVVTLSSWQNVKKMVETIHREYKNLEINCKRSGEHRVLNDVISGMKFDLIQKRSSDEDKDKFVVRNARIWYYYCFLCKSK
jgi:hypothetical protein